MKGEQITSMERLLTTLQHKEPDRVPFFISLTMYCAKEMGMSIKEYFSRPENVVEGQLRKLKKYRDDFVTNFCYAAAETEAWGGDVIFQDNGPPNAGRPIIEKFEDIEKMKLPNIKNSVSLQRVLKITELLKGKVRDEVPIIGVVISPFSLPIIQMGFDKYIELLYEEPAYFNHLIKLNERFCVEWANAQLEAGATAIGYFDPVSSPTIIPKDMYLKTGFQIARRTFPKIKGPIVTLFAGGRCIPIFEELTQTRTAIIGVSSNEDLGDVKSLCRNKVSLIGNLNAIEMCRWTPEMAEDHVKDCLAKAGMGGGFILCDTHGEIPWQVPEDVLRAISEAVHKWGRYPLTWVEEFSKVKVL